MKKFLWMTLAFTGFSMAQQASVTDMPDSPEAFLEACSAQESQIPAEALDQYRQACQCVAEKVDFEAVKEFKGKNDVQGLTEHLQKATIDCAAPQS